MRRNFSCLASVGQPVCATAAQLLSQAAQEELACSGERWVRSLQDLLEHQYNRAAYDTKKRTNSSMVPFYEPNGHARFHSMLQPPSRSACSLTRFGKGDGAKLLCQLENMARESCTIFSIGSRGDIQFEQDVLRRTNCSVEIFDCTVPRCTRKRIWPAGMRTGRVRYHQICIDRENRRTQSSQIRSDWKGSARVQYFTFRTYEHILAKLKLSAVTAMKMDIEGFEFPVLGAMLRSRSAALPSQIAFELHWQTQMTSLSWNHRTKTAGEIALFARALYDAGYRTLSRADNKRCPHCSEFNVVRLFCPPAPMVGEEIRPEADEPELSDTALGWGPTDPGQGC